MRRQYRIWTSRKTTVRITKTDRKRYVLKQERDIRILLTCKMLLKKQLTKEDRRIVKLMQSQLVGDWRKPLVVELNKVVRKYK